MKIKWAEDAWDDYLFWQTQDKRTLKKINRLIKSMQRTPFYGEGNPEELKGNLSGLWSRRIDEKNRIVYRVIDEELEIIQCRYHYNDH